MTADKKIVPKEDPQAVTGERIKSFIERIERLESEKSDLADDVKEVYSEAKATGFDTKTIKKLVKLRKMDKEKRQEEQALLELYAKAIQLELF